MRSETAAVPTRNLLPQAEVCSVVEARATISEAILQLLASTRVALVAIRLSYEPEEKHTQIEQSSRRNRDQSIDYLLQSIRPLVRKTDRVFRHDNCLYFVLLASDLQGAAIVEERLWETLLWRVHNMSELMLLPPTEMTIGHSACPDPHTNLDELFSAATHVSQRAGCATERPGRTSDQPDSSDEVARPTEREALPQLARKLGIPYLSLLPGKPPQSVLHVVNPRLAQELHCYPVGRERNILTVAMLNPQDRSALERLRRETGLRIFPVLTHPDALERALAQLS